MRTFRLHPKSVTESEFQKPRKAAGPSGAVLERVGLRSVVSGGPRKLLQKVVRPTGIEPVLRVPETLVISFSLRARERKRENSKVKNQNQKTGVFTITLVGVSQRTIWLRSLGQPPFPGE